MVQTLDDRPGAGSPVGALPPLGPSVRRADSSAIRDLLALSEQPGIISLAGGKPAPDTFPVEALRGAADAVLARDGAAALQYSATEGYRPLREWVAGHRGTDVERVTVTTGSQQGLDLAARALVGPGDVVVSAEPGYVGALQAFRLAGATLVAVASDRDGLRVDDLAARLAAGLRPALVYLVADLSNPTGATLSAERRDALVALAERYGFWVVEDDPYGALRWAGQAPPPLAGRSDHVVTLGTVSKVLCPGLRVGYVLAPPVLSQAVVRIKQAADLHTATFSQRLVHELVTTPGFLADHLAGLPGRYRTRADALTAALRAELGDRLAFAEPEGGMFLWARVAGPAVDTTALLDRALAAGVAFVPGRAFAVEGAAASTPGPGRGAEHAHADHLRLSFATAMPHELAEAARRLAIVVRTA
jgi:2-aminoadipate transaminase